MFSEAILGNRVQDINSISNFFLGHCIFSVSTVHLNIKYCHKHVYYLFKFLICLGKIYVAVDHHIGPLSYQHAASVSISSTLLEHFSRSAFANHFFSLGSFVSR